MVSLANNALVFFFFCSIKAKTNIDIWEGHLLIDKSLGKSRPPKNQLLITKTAIP